MSARHWFRITLVPGDGPEVTAAARQVIEATGVPIDRALRGGNLLTPDLGGEASTTDLNGGYLPSGQEMMREIRHAVVGQSWAVGDSGSLISMIMMIMYAHFAASGARVPTQSRLVLTVRRAVHNLRSPTLP